MFRRAYDALSSFGLTIVILVLMLLVTWKGTLAQVDVGLFQAQKKYFDSIYFTEDLFGIPVPVPGGYLLMGLLFLNLFLGGMLRLRRTRATAGILVIHVGIAFLLVAGFVKFHHSTEGSIRFHAGQQRQEYTSYHEWEFVVAAPEGEGRWREYVVPGDRFLNLPPSESLTFTHPDLPFETRLSEVARNSTIRPEEGAGRTSQPVVNGFWIQRLPLDKEAERNLVGAIVDVVPRDGTPAKGIVWGVQRAPFAAEIGGTTYAFDLRKKRYGLDFAVRLDRFKKTDHPGTESPKDFRSWVTKIEDGVEQQVEISMNEPLRHKGYILFQTAWDRPDAASNGEYYSVLAVVRNPSDQWPLYSCIIIAAGLLLHFVRKLGRYAKAQASQAAPTAGATS
ncbi:MAG: cytochrome c biogenesis protein ResB [Planctomycetota bacterium JB042]